MPKARRAFIHGPPGGTLAAQPHGCISVERPIHLVEGSYLEVVRPAAQGRFTLLTSGVVSCHVPDRLVSAWIFPTTP